ncbi:hypothetical protein MYU51_016749 [Penicillium brevicompactum]
MTLSQSSSVTPAQLDSAWPPAHIWETMGAADRASWLGQISRDRARRLEMDVAETDLRHRRPRVDLQGDENLEENREPPPEVKPLIDIFPGVSAALLTRVFERKSKAAEVIRFKEKSVTEQKDQEDRVFKMTESGGTALLRFAAGVSPKHDGGWRRIHDLSWPPGQGLNQGIPDSWSAIEYITIDDIYEQVTQAGPGCTIIKRDIKDAFQIVPVAEDNQHLLDFQWNDSTYVECCLPFGLATAPYDFVATFKSLSVSDPTGPFDRVYNGVTDYLRIPRNTKKDQQGTCVTVSGVQIDSIAMEARLSPDKLCRATLDAAAALSAASLSLKQTERLTGSLAFSAFPHGRSARRRISHEVRDDLEWWRDSLSLFNGVLFIDPSRRSITHLYTDAANTGQGLFFFSSKSISDCWLAHCHQLHPSNAASLALSQVAHAHINTTEVDAILQGFLLFSHRWLHHTLVVHTDSSTAYTALSKGFLHGPLGVEPPAWFSSRAPQLNAGHLKLLWSGLSANTRSVYHSVQRNYEKHYVARRLNPITKVRAREPISRDTITKLSAGLATLPLQSLEMTATLLDDLNFATACRVAFAGFLRFGEFTNKTEDHGTRPIFLATKLTRSGVRFSSSFDHVQLTLKRSKMDRCHEGA